MWLIHDFVLRFKSYPSTQIYFTSTEYEYSHNLKHEQTTNTKKSTSGIAELDQNSKVTSKSTMK